MYKQRGSGSPGILGFLGIIFIVLKVMEIHPVSTWSWWWVTAPLWGGVLLLFAYFAISLCLTVQGRR